MGDCVESLAEVEVDNIYGSPFIYPASHVIIESYQIGRADFPLVNPCWLLLITSFSSTCLLMTLIDLFS